MMRKQPSAFGPLAAYWKSKRPVLLVCPSLGIKNLVGGSVPSLTGTVSTVQDPKGTAFKPSGTDGYYTYPDYYFGGTEPITVVAFSESLGSTSGGAILAQGTEIVLRKNGAASGVEFVLNSFTTNDRVTASVSVTRPGGGVVWGGSYGPSGQLTAYVNTSYGRVTPTGTYANISNGFEFGGSGALPDFNDNIYLLGVFRSEFSIADFDRLYANPWQIFDEAKPQQSYYVAAGGTTVTPTTGEIQWTGATPSLFTRRDATPTAGALAWTGEVISYTTGGGISTQSPLVGEIVWGGNTPAIYTIKTLAPGGGEITWTGSTPTITTITGKEVAPLAGSLEWTGSAPSLYTRVNVSPATGAIAWTGSTISYTTGDHCQWTVEARVSGNWNTETRYTGSWTTESRPSGTWNRKTRICE